MTKRRIIIATRESPLALQQAQEVKQQLEQLHPQLTVSLLGITTQADTMLSVSLRQIGGKGLFVKELEEALLQGRADIAVHSMKDVPMELPPGLSLPVIMAREDVRDVFVSNHYATLQALPRGAVVGTSSLRRQTQLAALRSDVVVKPLRGNIHTRLNRLEKGDFDAIILAAAGLRRMQLTSRIRSYLSTEEMLPSAGQGALGIECCDDNAAIMALIAPLNHPATHLCVSAEREVCKRLNGGCQAPVAAYAALHHDQLIVKGLVANHDGTRLLKAQLTDKSVHALQMGKRVGEMLLQQGADAILQEMRHG